MRISFLGDIAFNDYYIDAYKKGLNPFLNLQPVLSSSDFIIGNLECMAKGEQGENMHKKPRLTTTVETLNYLNTLNVNMVSLAHNHIYDHLEDGFLKTTVFLENNKIDFLGASLKKEKVDDPKILTLKGINIGFLNFVTDDTNPNLPLDAEVFLNVFNLERAIANIKLLKKKVNQIVLLLHWGGRVEGGLYPDFDQPKIAKKLIDAGVDLIIGHHSHTIQPYEIYKGKYIFYSLGNFCFSDYSFENKYYEFPKRGKETALVNIEFNELNYTVDINYFKNQIEYYEYDKQYFLWMYFRNFLFHWVLKIKLMWNLYFFSKKYMLPFILFLRRKKMSKMEKLISIYRSFRKYI